MWTLVFLLVVSGVSTLPTYGEHPYQNPNQYPVNEFYQTTPHPPYHRHSGVKVAEWNWGKVGVFFTFTSFIVITGLSKVAFHHAHWLSSRVPESCCIGLYSYVSLSSVLINIVQFASYIIFHHLMIIVGVVVGTILHLCGVNEPDDSHPDNKKIAFPIFTPDLFFFVLLPPVILESAYSLYDRSFLDNLGTILMHAVVGTILNTFLIGPALYGLSAIGAMGHIMYIPMTDMIVFSALISAVDPVAVLAIFQEVGVNKDLYYLLFGESLLNDAVTVVLYTTTVTFTTMPVVGGAQYGLACVAFFTVSLGGLLVGIVCGLASALITKTTKDVRVVEPLAVLGVAYLSYMAAELFHFSGIISIIGCGVTQAHYALKNISDNSRTTVVYFTKMISSTSDAIIFLFLGMVLVSKQHMWHTGFVLWTLLLCFVCRFIGVFSLTGLMNLCRVKKVNLQEQLIMAYGGLRGAVAFSLVKMLDHKNVHSKPLLMTTTLAVILMTVFAQGSTIKLFVNVLNIEKSNDEEKTLLVEINSEIMDVMLAGVEEIAGLRGDNYIRRKIEHFDSNFLSRIFLNTGKSNSLMRLYEQLSLAAHFAHLYGPVALVEDKKTMVLHPDTGTKRKLPRSASARQPKPRTKFQELFPGVELRRRTASDTTRPELSHMDLSLSTSTEQLRRAFRSNPYQKFYERYDPHQVYDGDLDNMLQRRALMARRITHEAALMNRISLTPPPTEYIPPFCELYDKPLRKIHSDLETLYPEDVEGVEVLVERARRRVARHSSTASSASSPALLPTVRRTASLAPTLAARVRKVSASLRPYPEASESQHLMEPAYSDGPPTDGSGHSIT